VIIRKSRSKVIVLLLVATLGMTALLAYEAQQAARSHRATAENVLRDYAAFGAWELSRVGRQQLLSVIQTELQEVHQAVKDGNLARALTASHACGSCSGVHRMSTVFHAPLPGGELTFAGAPADPAIVALLQASVAEGLRKPAQFTCPALRVVAPAGAPAVVVWRPVFDRADTAIGVVGFVSDPQFVSTVFEKILRSNPLLPPSLLPDGTNPNAAVAVRVSSPDGAELFASSADATPYAATERFQADLGELALSVALRPDAAGRLIIGGLPRERLPLVVGLLTLTAGLVFVALVQLRREAELSRLRSDFVSGVSHELRTPLAQIRMFTETLLLGRVRSELEGRRSLEIISRESQRLAQLVENVLFFARAERRRPQIAAEAAPLAPIVADVVESFAPLASARQARIVTRLDETVAARVDAGAVRQILLNLLDNAVKYGPQDQTVTVSLLLDGGSARLMVDDEGTGIAPEHAERVWDPFDRLTTAETAVGGAGIGLAIVRQLADLHDGRAWVERGPVGARFIVEIPGAWSGESAAAVA
jgi:signal transduction histidine kinase